MSKELHDELLSGGFRRTTGEYRLTPWRPFPRGSRWKVRQTRGMKEKRRKSLQSALAHSIASQTVLGAGRLLRDTGKHPAQLRSEVCTPGGTTIYGLHTLEQGGLRATTMSAVESATERARELGRKSAAGSRK